MTTHCLKILIGTKPRVMMCSLSSMLVLGACGGSGSNPNNTALGATNSTLPIVSASQIVYRDSNGQLVAMNKSGFIKTAISAAEIDTTTKILAENVILAEGTNSLSSKNLQQALDDEIAPNLSKLLPGSTWSVVNKDGADSNYNGTRGQVTFNTDGSITYAGAIAAFGIGASLCVPAFVAKYEGLSSKAIYVSRLQYNNQTANVINLISAKKGELIIAGQGGCGLTSVDRISTLTLVSSKSI